MIVVVDTEANISRLLPVVEEMIDTGLIVISEVETIRIQRSPSQEISQ